MRLGRRARRHGGLGERLVGGVAGRDAGELADLGSVERDERLPLLESYDVHGGERNGPAPGGESGPVRDYATALRADSESSRCASRAAAYATRPRMGGGWWRRRGSTAR